MSRRHLSGQKEELRWETVSKVSSVEMCVAQEADEGDMGQREERFCRKS